MRKGQARSPVRGTLLPFMVKKRMMVRVLMVLMVKGGWVMVTVAVVMSKCWC